MANSFSEIALLGPFGRHFGPDPSLIPAKVVPDISGENVNIFVLLRHGNCVIIST
ncbi:hypothetical protein PILCRDRAFT_11625 [Piloderma croceum F 1598]|uniref:Uncharacterized protein n=1 Tax=Piloderma croceum (strain F 1598) TaxID=765440 RepID=A0A0C3FDK5_PILCF|nr:hypothetical protein PILCRDRAFT_11625 [Piloderma croceum F 1598]